MTINPDLTITNQEYKVQVFNSDAWIAIGRFDDVDAAEKDLRHRQCSGRQYRVVRITTTEKVVAES